MLRFVRRNRGAKGRRGVRTLVVGTGPAGRVLAQRLGSESDLLDPIGFVTDEAEGVVGHRRIAGLPLLGRVDRLVEIALGHAARAAVLAVPHLPAAQVAELAGRAWSAGLDVHLLPEQPDPPDHRNLRPDALRELPLSELVGRAAVEADQDRVRPLVRGRRVVITGASSPLGVALTAAVAALRPAQLWAIDATDDGSLLIADAKPHLVIHAVQREGLAELEQDPGLGVTGNVLPVQRVVDAAVEAGVERLILVSTGLAADPVSVLGATMRLAELVVLAAVGGRTRIAAVRLGTLLGIPGSLLATLAERVPEGRTVAVAHPEAACRFMTVAEAVTLALEGAALAEEAEIFALNAGTATLMPVTDLIHRYVELLALPSVTIRFTGLGPGERLADKLFSDDEVRVPTAHPAISATRPLPPPAGLRPLLDELYDAAGQGDEPRVRLLLRRLLPEYHPVRRSGRLIAPPESDAVADVVPDYESP